MAEVINPFIFYLGIALGALGVFAALPRRGASPQIIGGLIAAIGAGLVILGLSLKAFDAEQLPNLYFYVFALIALGASLRVITHQRPVYAALYFILTILASAGLYLILAAEFMAFALVIIYAGAILITYLFVIMMATQAPSEEEVDRLADYDAQSREPAMAVGAGFVLLAVLSAMLFQGSAAIEGPAGPLATAHAQIDDQQLTHTDGSHAPATGHADEPDAQPARTVLERLPRRVELALRRADLMEDREEIVRGADGRLAIDAGARTVQVGIPLDDGKSFVEVRTVDMPESLTERNVESLAFNFLNEHPGAIEIAGVILLMAMLGAVVLSRRQVDIDEAEKARQAGHLTGSDGEGTA
ncbi:MAG: NADH-quinone oxidoreductase subunit J [Phycisphaerales bacterium JB037]